MPWPMIELNGRRAYKLLACRFPRLHHFERIAQAPDFEMLDAIEALTSDQAREEIGQIELLDAEVGARRAPSAPVIAALTTFSPAGSLFSDGSYGVFYGQMDENTAIAQTRFEVSAFLATSTQAQLRLRLKLYSLGLAGQVADLRNVEGIPWKRLASGACAESRDLGRSLRAAGLAGAVYPHARIPGADSLALFRASTVDDCAEAAVMEWNWNGETIDRSTLVAN